MIFKFCIILYFDELENLLIFENTDMLILG